MLMFRAGPRNVKLETSSYNCENASNFALDDGNTRGLSQRGRHRVSRSFLSLPLC